MSDETWSSKPFVAFDGGTSEGGAPAECLVTKGVATVEKIDNRGKTAEVFLNVEKLKRPIRGWINTYEKAFTIVENAYKSGGMVQFRHEIQRKADVDRSAHIKDLRSDADGNPSIEAAKYNTKKLFVGFGDVNGELVLTDQHATSPKNDSNGSGDSIPADSPNAITASPSVSTTPSGDMEAKPWVGVNGDGSVNAGSYAITASVDVYFALHKAFLNASEDSVRDSAIEFMKLIDFMQVRIYGGDKGTLKGSPNRFYSSHLMGRRIIIELLDGSHDVDIEDKDKRRAWERSVAESAFSIWEWAIRDYHDTIRK